MEKQIETVDSGMGAFLSEGIFQEESEILEGLLEQDDPKDVLNNDDVDIIDELEKSEKSTNPVKKEESVGENKNQEEEKDKPEKKPGISSSPNLYSSFAQTLKKGGKLFQSLDSDKLQVKGLDDLEELLEIEIENRLQERLDPIQKEFKEALEIGMPKQEFAKFQEIINNLEGIEEDFLEDESDEAKTLRYNLIKQNLILQNVSADKADKLAKVMIKDGEDIEEARKAKLEMADHYKKLYKDSKKKYEDTAVKTKAKEKETVDSFKKKVDEIKDISGFELDDKTKKKIFDINTKIVARSKDDNKPLNTIMKAREENPSEFDIKLSWLFHKTDGFKDFSYFTGKGKKQASNEFEEILKKSANFSQQGDLFDEEETFNFADELSDESIFGGTLR